MACVYFRSYFSSFYSFVNCLADVDDDEYNSGAFTGSDSESPGVEYINLDDDDDDDKDGISVNSMSRLAAVGANNLSSDDDADDDEDDDGSVMVAGSGTDDAGL